MNSKNTHNNNNNNNSNSNNNTSHTQSSNNNNNNSLNEIDNWNEIELTDFKNNNNQHSSNSNNNSQINNNDSYNINSPKLSSSLNENIYIFDNLNVTNGNSSPISSTFSSPNLFNHNMIIDESNLNNNSNNKNKKEKPLPQQQQQHSNDDNKSTTSSEENSEDEKESKPLTKNYEFDIENTDYTVLIEDENEKGFSFKKLKSFLGPALFVSVGYMDPGNWATDIEGGSRFGYSLVWVLLLSNIMALFLQTLVIKLALVTKNDLAQMCRQEFSLFISYVLWIITELAIVATDLAEVIGTAIGLNILFGLPLLIGVAITSLDTLLFLALQRWGIRKLEFFILFLLSSITLCFVIELFLSKPIASEVFRGFIPTLNSESVMVATGIVGATTMPHNLFLHGSVVKSRKIKYESKSLVKQAYKYNVIDTVLALNCAFFVNISILMLAASVFWKKGIEVTELNEAYKMLEQLMDGKLAAILFGLALFLSGNSSTITGTMAGQVVMEGFVNIKIKPWIRRIVTRLMAIIPAILVIVIFGEKSTYTLLILSQVILSIGLPFAVVPLIIFTSRRDIMGDFKNHTAIIIINTIIALFIIGLNMATIFQWIQEFLYRSTLSKIFTIIFLIPLSIGLGLLLVWIVISKTSLYKLLFEKLFNNLNLYYLNNFNINNIFNQQNKSSSSSSSSLSTSTSLQNSNVLII